MSVISRLLVSGAIAATLLGCEKDATQLLVTVNSNLVVNERITTVNVYVADSVVGELYNNPVELTPRDRPMGKKFTLPLTFGVLGDEGSRVDVQITAFNFNESEQALFTRRAFTGFVKGKMLNLPMFLAGRCITEAATCDPESETCGQNGCEDANVDETTLEEVTRQEFENNEFDQNGTLPGSGADEGIFPFTSECPDTCDAGLVRADDGCHCITPGSEACENDCPEGYQPGTCFCVVPEFTRCETNTSMCESHQRCVDTAQGHGGEDCPTQNAAGPCFCVSRCSDANPCNSDHTCVSPGPTVTCANGACDICLHNCTGLNDTTSCTVEGFECLLLGDDNGQPGPNPQFLCLPPDDGGMMGNEGTARFGDPCRPGAVRGEFVCADDSKGEVCINAVPTSSRTPNLPEGECTHECGGNGVSCPLRYVCETHGTNEIGVCVLDRGTPSSTYLKNPPVGGTCAGATEMRSIVLGNICTVSCGGLDSCGNNNSCVTVGGAHSYCTQECDPTGVDSCADGISPSDRRICQPFGGPNANAGYCSSHCMYVQRCANEQMCNTDTGVCVPR